MGFHPHEHLMASDGAFTPTGELVPMPRVKKKDIEG